MIVDLPTVVDSAVSFRSNPSRATKSSISVSISDVSFVTTFETVNRGSFGGYDGPTDKRSGNLVELDGIFLLVCVRRSYRLDGIRYGRCSSTLYNFLKKPLRRAAVRNFILHTFYF